MKSLSANPTIFLSNDRVFHTLEGEGKSIGMPTVFMRMAMCNLTCSGWATPENPNGCDSKVSWMVKNKYTFEELFKYYEERGYHVFIKRGDILKLTGGEPFLQEKALYEWTQAASERWDCDLNIEFETNTTLVPKFNWQMGRRKTCFVCSPKLSNNGDPEAKRYNPLALRWHAGCVFSTFKFVICCEKDLEELFTRYINILGIEHRRVWLMPECTSTAEFKVKAPWIAELCKKHNFNFSTRLQIMIWEKALGV